MAKTKARQPAPRRVPKKAAARQRPARSSHRERRPLESLSVRSATPGFTVNDIEKSVAWYRDVLGFTVKDRWEREGKLAGVELAAGKVSFLLSQDDGQKGRDRAKGEGFRVYCTTVQDVDRLAERIQVRGGTLIQAPRDQPWGARDFAVADPDGFKITIVNEK